MDGGWDSARGKREGGGCGAPGDAETLCNRGGSGGVAVAEAEAGARGINEVSRGGGGGSGCCFVGGGSSNCNNKKRYTIRR